MTFLLLGSLEQLLVLGGPFIHSVRITTENELKIAYWSSETYVKQLGEIFQDQFSYLWYCKFKDTCPMLKVCTYHHFRSISTLFSYIIFQTAGVFFLVLPRFLELRWSMGPPGSGLLRYLPGPTLFFLQKRHFTRISECAPEPALMGG